MTERRGLTGMRDPRHTGCRRMIEDAARERDEARAERDQWKAQYEELNGSFEQHLDDLKATYNEVKRTFEQHLNEVRQQRDGAVVELAMVREGLTT